ncbi:phage tail assembly chaperone, partial [Escherichia coli]|uniref:phage tail assembly chaperone n=1 Tax=Escherichia coli TaxID=562 RepID=UPI00201ACA21
CVLFFFFKQKAASGVLRGLVGSEMCIRDRCDTDLQRVFTPDDREQVLAVYGPVHARLLRQALELIADAESARKK